jgi:hypothetical protein
MRCFLLSRAALPASSRISAARYSSTAARYTAPRQLTPSRTTGGRTGRAGADALRVVAALEQAVYTADGELQPGLGGAARAFARAALGRAARLAAAGRLAGLALAAL